ncbi:MAG: PEP-CTERM sorting domain-containing protein [bacterium]|nr:PEP-CTERM sorting domain-containing protein [bacterium]
MHFRPLAIPLITLATKIRRHKEQGFLWSDPSISGDLAFKLTGNVVPEPTTFILIGFGLVGIWFFRRRIHAKGRNT